MSFTLVVLYALAALLAIEGLTALLRRRADPVRVQNRLRGLAQRVAQIEKEKAESILRSRVLALPSLTGLEKTLYRARSSLTVRRFLALSVILAACGFATGFVLTGDLVRSVPALLPGLLPWLVARKSATKRVRLFEEQLPDALELMTRCMRTGHALGAGFQMVGEELADPIGTEFGLVAEELRLGLEIREALDNLMSRFDVEALPYFTTAVLIQRQTGGNLAELLDNLGTLLRERGQFHGRVRALTAQGRGAATFLALWLPFIIGLVWVLSPSYLSPLIENSWGHAVLATAFALDGLAYYMSLRIADVAA